MLAAKSATAGLARFSCQAFLLFGSPIGSCLTALVTEAGDFATVSRRFLDMHKIHTGAAETLIGRGFLTPIVRFATV